MKLYDFGCYGLIPIELYFRKRNYPANLSVSHYNENSFYPHALPYPIYSELYSPNRIQVLIRVLKD